jgi:hypothetical protein
MNSVDANFKVQANHPHACFQWQLQKALKAACAAQTETWVRAVRAGEDFQPAKNEALRCFSLQVPECRKAADPLLEKCLIKHAELAVAQLLAGENARLDLHS